MPEPTDAYLSLIDWPEHLDAESRAHALVRATGMDLFTARLRIARGTPQVVARLPGPRARGAVDLLHRAGATAFAPTLAEVRGIPEPLRAKRLIAPEGPPEPMFMVEPWRGEGRGLLARDIFLLVRARLKRSKTRVVTDDGTRGTFAAGVTMAAGPLAGMAAAALGEDGGSVRSGGLRVTEMLDIHARDGSRVRVDGDKFSFEVLGSDRSYTDRDNMDRLALLLATGAPGALVDTGFSTFHCPPEIARDTWLIGERSSVQSRDDGPSFDFYSCWASLLYRSLLAR